MPGVSKTHFLNENARRVGKSLGDATGLTGLGIHLIEILPGANSTESHRHFQEDECVYILAGHARVVLDGQTHALHGCDFVGLPAGGPAHQVDPKADPNSTVSKK